jgi:hypothetical protein
VLSVLSGTNTAVVGIFIDKNKYPNAVDTIVVYPGQKILFAGPDQFEIFFKDNKSPVKDSVLRSSNGSLVVEIPTDIFERNLGKSSSTRAKRELLYRYGIKVGDMVKDPNILIRER